MVTNELTSILLTPRLRLRPMLAEDAGHLLLLHSDPEVIRYTDDPVFATADEAKAYLLRISEPGTTLPTPYVISPADSTGFMGWCGLRFQREEELFDISFRLLRSCWGKGFATEAAGAVVRDAFERHGILRLRARCVRENTGASRVIEKLGFRQVRNFFAHGYLCDEYLLQRHDLPFGRN